MGMTHYMQYETESEVAQSCLTLCNPMDCSLPGSTVHGIFQARILEWVAIAFSMCSIVSLINMEPLRQDLGIRTYCCIVFDSEGILCECFLA